MKEAIKLVDELKNKGLIKDFVLIGSVATTFYTEPFLTNDLDILFVPVKERFDILAPIYSYLMKKGYKTVGEQIEVGNVLLHLITTPISKNSLLWEAYNNANIVDIGGVQVKVLKPEYLIVEALRTGRFKDKAKVEKILEQVDINKDLLQNLLNKYNLSNKFLEIADKVDKKKISSKDEWRIKMSKLPFIEKYKIITDLISFKNEAKRAQFVL